MEFVKDFLTFDRFLAPYLLLTMYYLGASAMPAVAIVLRFKAKQSLTFSKYTDVIFLFLLIVAEIFWRVLFEFLVGYFNMHEYLRRLVESH